jgi:hypothetical protein
MSGVVANKCRNMFKKLGILHVSCKYMIFLMFVVDNQKNFQSNSSVHRLDTKNKNHLYLLIANLSCLQRDVSYCAMKIVNSLPHAIKNHRNERVQF